MTKITCSSPQAFVPIEQLPHDPAAQSSPHAGPPQPPVVEPPARQSSAQERAAIASRTHLNTVELSRLTERTSSSAAPLRLDDDFAEAPFKNELYRPSKRDNHGFNMAVTLDSREKDSDTFLGDTRVACRHLAYEYFLSPKKTRFLAAMTSERAIAMYFSGGKLRQANQGYLQLLSAATLKNSVVVSVNTFSTQLMRIARKMTQSRQSKADFLMTSSNHVMAVNVQIKENNRVCVTVYDPNNTTNHDRVEADDFNDDEALQTAELPLNARREQGNHAFTLHATHDFFRPGEALADLDLRTEPAPVQVMASFICNALDRDDPALLKQLITKASRDFFTHRSALKAALAGTELGTPGLFRALQNGRSDVVEAWMQGASNLADRKCLSKGDLFELFRAQASSGENRTDGLYMAFKGGRMNTVATYLAQVTDATRHGLLTKPQAKALFGAANRGEISGIDVLFKRADAKSLATVVEQLEQSFQRNVFSGDDVKEVLLGIGSASTAKSMATTSDRDVQALKQALQPLVTAGALLAKDVDSLFSTRGFIDTSLNAMFSRLWR
ncbi:ShET2/EspL2 family type III secretion system effector toxin [Pseudomonas sp. SDO528_S397]